MDDNTDFCTAIEYQLNDILHNLLYWGLSGNDMKNAEKPDKLWINEPEFMPDFVRVMMMQKQAYYKLFQIKEKSAVRPVKNENCSGIPLNGKDDC